MGSEYPMTIDTYNIYHPLLGDVTIKIHPRATRISGRWKLGKVIITAPRGISKINLENALNTIATKLIKHKKTLCYTENQIISCPDITFEITRQHFRKNDIIVKPALPVTKIQVGTDIDIANPKTTAAISRYMEHIAHQFAPHLLLPRAKEIAQSLGVQPDSWCIGRGRRILGTCNSHRVITLSSTLVFLTRELRDYIVCHELAHLSEMNHSAAFHSLCNHYCGGREAELRSKLKSFTYPILR